MKIAHLIYSLNAGGAETFVKELSVEMSSSGHDVSILLLDTFQNSNFELQNYKYLKKKGIPVIELRRTPGKLGFTSFLKLLNILKTGKYNILHSHLVIPDIFAGIASKFYSQTKHVSTIHNSVILQEGLIAKIWFQSLKKASVVFCSKIALESNKKMFNNAIYISNGINFQKFDIPDRISLKSTTRINLGIDLNIPLFINVGRLMPQKNQMVLLESLLLLKQCKLPFKCIICGDGPQRNKFEKFVNNNGLNKDVLFLGIRQDIVNLMLASDIFISTSIHEGLPLTVLEAFGAGLTCILSPIKEHIEISKNVEGVYIANTNSPNSMAKLMSELIQCNLPQKEQLQKVRKTSLKPYSIKTCAEHYLRLYRHTSIS